MFEFKITGAKAKLANFNPRVEKAGNDTFPACDLKITCNVGPSVLAFFSPTMEADLFDKSAPIDLAGGTPLRYPHIEYPLKDDHELVGAKAKIGFGLGEIILPDAKVNEFRITPMQGGVVGLCFRLQARPSNPLEDGGRLFVLQEREIEISIEPPEAPPIDADQGKGAGKEQAAELV